MADALEKQLKPAFGKPGIPKMDLSLEANKHPKEDLKAIDHAPKTELSKEQAAYIKMQCHQLQSGLKEIVDNLCGCRFSSESILGGEACLDPNNVRKPDYIMLSRSALKVDETLTTFNNNTGNLVLEKTPYEVEAKYRTAILNRLTESSKKLHKTIAPLKTDILAQEVAPESAQAVLDKAVESYRAVHWVLVELDKWQSAYQKDWFIEQKRAELHAQMEAEKRAHEEAIAPIRLEKAVIDRYDGLITGFASLPERLEKMAKLTDPQLQSLPKYLKKIEPDYDEPVATSDDLVYCVHPATAALLLAVMGFRKLNKSAHTHKELNPDRPTKEQIVSGIQTLSEQIHVLKGDVERFLSTPSKREPNATWDTIQELEKLHKDLAQPSVADTLNELEALPGKVEQYDIPTLRACFLRAMANQDLQRVICACDALNREREAKAAQIQPPAPKKERYYDPYGLPAW